MSCGLGAGRASVPRIRLRSARIPVAAGVFCLSRTPAVLGGVRAGTSAGTRGFARLRSPVPRGRAAAENGFLKIVPHLRRTCGQLVRAHGGTHPGGSRALGTPARAGSAAPGQYGSPFRDRCGRFGGRGTFFGYAVFFSFRRRGCAAVPDVVPAQETIFGRHRDGRVSAFQGSGVPPGDGSALGGFRAGIVHEPPPCRRALASGRTDAGYGHAHGGYPLLRPSFATARSAHVRRRTVEARFPSQPPSTFFERAGCRQCPA